jgi:hypothetical protein
MTADYGLADFIHVRMILAGTKLRRYACDVLLVRSRHAGLCQADKVGGVR